MTIARQIADLVDTAGDVKLTNLDNVPPSDWNTLLNVPAHANTDTRNAANISAKNNASQMFAVVRFQILQKTKTKTETLQTFVFKVARCRCLQSFMFEMLARHNKTSHCKHLSCAICSIRCLQCFYFSASLAAACGNKTLQTSATCHFRLSCLQCFSFRFSFPAFWRNRTLQTFTIVL